MVNLKLSARESNAMASVAYEPGDGPAYPYGLTIYLDTETLAKLGIDKLPDVGAVFHLEASVTVTGTSSRKQQDGDDSNCVDLQITDMELGAGGEASESTESVLYG